MVESEQSNPELTQEQKKEMLEKSLSNEAEAFFILKLEAQEDKRHIHYHRKQFEIIYGKADVYTINEVAGPDGNVVIYQNLIIPRTKNVIIKVYEESDNPQWRIEYFYFFSYRKGWVRIS